MIKYIPVIGSEQPLFTSLPTIPQFSPTSPELAREAKTSTNAEKGYAADEKYLGKRQNSVQRARKYARTGLQPYDDVDYDDPTTFCEWMD